MPIISRPTPTAESHDIFDIPTPFPGMKAVALPDGHGVEVLTTLEGTDLPLPILRGEAAIEGKTRHDRQNQYRAKYRNAWGGFHPPKPATLTPRHRVGWAKRSVPIIARPTHAVESHGIFGTPTPFPGMEAVALPDGHGVEDITTLEGADLPLPILRGEGAMDGKEAR